MFGDRIIANCAAPACLGSLARRHKVKNSSEFRSLLLFDGQMAAAASVVASAVGHKRPRSPPSPPPKAAEVKVRIGTRFTATSKSPPLQQELRFGSVTGSLVKSVLSDKTLGEAMAGIFQYDPDRELYDEEFRLNVTAGKEYEAAVGLAYLKLLNVDRKIDHAMFYVHSHVHSELPWMRVTPDAALAVPDVRHPGKLVLSHMCQIKFKAAVARKDEHKQWWELHLPSCLRRKRVGCQCAPAEEYMDQVQMEMFVTGVRENHLAVGTHLRTEYLPVKASHFPGRGGWYASVRSRLVEVYDAYLLWYHEDDVRPETTAGIRRYVAAFNRDTADAAGTPKGKRPFVDIDALLKRRPPNVDAIRKCRAWSAMRRRVRALRPVFHCFQELLGRDTDDTILITLACRLPLRG
jgi:hypothetical protein